MNRLLCGKNQHPADTGSWRQCLAEMLLAVSCLCTASGCGQQDAEQTGSAEAVRTSAATAPAESASTDAAAGRSNQPEPPAEHPGDVTRADGQSAEYAEQLVQQLTELLRQRLALMPAVARWKWADQKPVSDPEREQQLLARLVTEGEEAGLDPARLRPFFAAQFAASRERQQELFKRWETAGGPGSDSETPDLINVLRPQITRLSSDILAVLAALDREAARQPDTIQRELLRMSRLREDPPDAAWQPVRESLRIWAETLPQSSGSSQQPE